MSKVTFLNPWAQTLIPSRERLLSLNSPNQRPRIHYPPAPQSRSTVELISPSLDRRPITVRSSSGQAPGDCTSESSNSQDEPDIGLWNKWKIDTAEMSSRMAKLGLAAVLAYGLFDGVTYTTFFVLAFLGYEKSTGKNPAANLQALLGIVILMWTGNNITRPFRVAGAAASAPVIDKGLKKIQKYFNLPSQLMAFALIVSIVATSCLPIVGLLILSRWGK